MRVICGFCIPESITLCCLIFSRMYCTKKKVVTDDYKSFSTEVSTIFSKGNSADLNHLLTQ